MGNAGAIFGMVQEKCAIDETGKKVKSQYIASVGPE
jgi:hypothetical protein